MSCAPVVDEELGLGLERPRPPPLSPNFSSLLALIDSPGVTLVDILRDPAVVSAFKSNNPRLNERLGGESSLLQLLSLFRESGDRSLMQTITFLFLSANTFLLSKAASDISVIEIFSAMVYCRETSDYLLGLVGQILSSAATTFPDVFFAVLYRSPSFWTSMLMSLDREAVANTCLGLSQGRDRSFLWGYLVAALPDCGAISAPPSWNVDCDAVVNCKRVRLTPRHVVKVMKLLRSVIMTFEDERFFREAVAAALPSIITSIDGEAEVAAVFDLADALPVQECVLARALDVMSRAPLVATPAVEKAILYCAGHMDEATVRGSLVFIFDCFRADVANNFLYEAIRALLDAIPENYRVHTHFIKAMQHLIAFLWNRMGPDAPILKRAVLLDIAQSAGELPTFAGWALFLDKVLKQYDEAEPIPRDFEIPEAEMDPGLLQILAGNDELLPYVDAWIAGVLQGADPHGSTNLSPVAAITKKDSVPNGIAVDDSDVAQKPKKARKKKKSCRVA
jgi:hypothetical protein